MRLEDLRDSLIAVIVRYHDANVNPKIINDPNPDELLSDDLKKYIGSLLKENTLKPTLGLLIDATIKVNPSRRHLYHYLNHQIMQLNEMLSNKNPCSASDLERYKSNLTQMLLDIKQLLLTSKNQEYTVTCNALQSNVLNGLNTPGWIYGSTLCRSGLLLTKLLTRLSLSSTSSDTEIKASVEALCTEYNNVSLVLQLKKQATEGALIPYQAPQKKWGFFATAAAVGSALLTALLDTGEEEEEKSRSSSPTTAPSKTV